jgi:protein tyrosine phosphatase (PTP) superfamily phosphohydrolase (DUF442 family)
LRSIHLKAQQNSQTQKRPRVKNILNLHQTSESLCTAGQPATDQFSEIAKEGYSAVINLAMHNSEGAIADEGNIVCAQGMSYFHIPVPFDAPNAKQLKQFFGVMDGLAGEKVFVHCVVNARASAFTYKYLTLKAGKSSEQASSPLLTQWLPTMSDAWKSVMALSLEDIESSR